MKRPKRLLIKSTLVLASAILLLVAIPQILPPTLTSAGAVDLADSTAKHLSEVRHISLEEAKTRIAWQDNASVLDAQLRRTLLSDDYGGMWIDSSDDRVKVGLTGSATQRTDAKGIVEAKSKILGLQGAVDYIPVDYSFSDLEKGVQWLAERLSSLDRYGDWPIQVGITTDTNQIALSLPPARITLPQSQQNLINAAKDRFGSSLQIQRYTEMPNMGACNGEYCDPPLRGGVGIMGSNQYDTRWCTLGFIVRGDSGQRYALTAGHCQTHGGNGWATNNTGGTLKKIGPIHRTEYGQDGVDAMIIEIRDVYNWISRGWVYMRDGTAIVPYAPPSRNVSYEITDTDTSGDLVGDRVCLSGSTTGASCGPVRAVSVSAIMNTVRTTGLVRAGFLCWPW